MHPVCPHVTWLQGEALSIRNIREPKLLTHYNRTSRIEPGFTYMDVTICTVPLIRALHFNVLLLKKPTVHAYLICMLASADLRTRNLLQFAMIIF